MTEYWKCPECLSINEKQRLRCLCGYQLSDDKSEENKITKSQLLSPTEEPKKHTQTKKEKTKGYSPQKCPFCAGQLIGSIKNGRQCNSCGVGFPKGHKIDTESSDDIECNSNNHYKIEDDYDESSFP